MNRDKHAALEVAIYHLNKAFNELEEAQLILFQSMLIWPELEELYHRVAGLHDPHMDTLADLEHESDKAKPPSRVHPVLRVIGKSILYFFAGTPEQQAANHRKNWATVGDIEDLKRWIEFRR